MAAPGPDERSGAGRLVSSSGNSLYSITNFAKIPQSIFILSVMMNTYQFKIIHLILLALTGSAFLTACEDRRAKRYYEEVTIPASSGKTLKENSKDPYALLQEMLARGEDPHAFLREKPQNTEDFPKDDLKRATSPQSSLGWSAPQGWDEKSAGGMRLASFANSQYPSIDVSIVKLEGAAGGIRANIDRWLGQIQLPPFSEEGFSDFISHQENLTSKDGVHLTLVDFTRLQSQEGEDTPSMLAAIFEMDEGTIFVKMTGSIKEINKNRDQFKGLCQSIRKVRQ